MSEAVRQTVTYANNDKDNAGDSDITSDTDSGTGKQQQRQ